QRLATLAKSRGDLMKAILYYKRILKIHPNDSFAQNQLRLMLKQEKDEPFVAVNEVKWTRWQDFYRKHQRPWWQRWSMLEGNLSLLGIVVCFAAMIGSLQAFRLLPHPQRN